MYLPKKKPLIFLHGYLADSKSFSYQLGFFSNYFDVHAMDLKGFGTNKGMEFPYDLTDYCSDVKAYVLGRGLERPHVVAHSFGGRIALKLAYENPTLFDKLVLTGAAGLKPKRTLKYRVKTLTFKLLKPILGKDKLERFYSRDYLSLDSVMRESFKKIVSEHLDYTLCGIKNPTLIINGEKDGETPPYMAKKLFRGISDSRLIMIRNAGHFCFIDSPVKFNMEVKEFLLSR